jgi:hypothetical protein
MALVLEQHFQARSEAMPMTSLGVVLLVCFAGVTIFIAITLLVFAALIRSSQLTQLHELVSGVYEEQEPGMDTPAVQGPASRSAPRRSHFRLLPHAKH